MKRFVSLILSVCFLFSINTVSYAANIVKYLLVSFLYSKPSNRQIGQRTPSPQS